MITHDRYLINQTANYISELSPETHNLTHFRGNYRNYLQEKERQYQRLKQMREQQEKEIKFIAKKLGDLHVKEATYKPQRRDNCKMAFNFHKERNQKNHKRIVDQLKTKKTDLVENLVEIPLMSRRKLEIDFSSDSNFDPEKILIQLQNIGKSYGDQVLFKNLFLELKPSERLVIKGVNGTGKSTLLKIVMGIIQTDEGKVSISNQVKLGYLDQEQETINLNQTVIESLETDPLIKLEKEEIIQKLGSFGIFYSQELTLPLSQLSIGCRRKVQLIKIILQGANVLILDEPTNHIDLLSLEKIEHQLINFPGSIFAVSHDRYFNQKVSMDQNYLIGKNNELPWKVPTEMKYFSQITSGNTVLMGAKTFESIGKPLKNRHNIVITKNKEKYQNQQDKNLIFTSDLEGVLENYKGNKNQDIFVIGGREIYQQTYFYADFYYVSIVKGTYEGNIYFPFPNGEANEKQKKHSLEKPFKNCKLIKREEFSDFIAYIYKSIK
ncbi:1693_t:CDS:2 [Funneliformis geosporum]|nr:1693_t:CDS:2 [Funneliformis geosporum]